MSLTAGDTLGRYEIRGTLGAGGMGEVYRARDTVLERDVAVKVLPAEVADNPDRLQRFEREAKAVAMLSHPNILEIYDYGREGGVTFTVTELLEGASLRDRLGSGPIGWRTAARIGAEIADGLVAAHGRGVVHRDLKPGNIFLTSDGRVKILDFGLARLTTAARTEEKTEALESTVTSEGTMLGTLGYMAPEQVRGHATDHRSDVFSLGCVLYEMVGGRRAFEADSGADTMAAILTSEPDRLSSSGVDIPLDLELAIHRCLEKSPEKRFQSAADLAYVLRASVTDTGAARTVRQTPTDTPRTRWLVPAAVAVILTVIAVILWMAVGEKSVPTSEDVADFEPNRIVVDEFENHIGDPALEDFGIHVADSITTLLRQVPRLTLATNLLRSADQLTSPQVATADSDRPGRLAMATRSGLVVTGACYARGDQVEIRARIVDPWRDEVRQTFDAVRAPRSDPSPAVETLSQQVAGALALHVDGVIPLGLSRPVPLAAVREYASAMEHWMPPFDTGHSRLEQALEIDPTFHLARFRLLRLDFFLARYREAEARLQVLEAQLPNMTRYDRAWAHAARAQLERRPLDVLSALREAARLAPNAYLARNWAGAAAIFNNRPHEAVEVLKTIPFDWTSGAAAHVQRPFVNLCFAYHMLGDDESMFRLAADSLEHFPDAMVFYGLQANALGVMGRFDEMDDILERSLAIRWHTRTSAGISHTYTARELRAHGYPEQSLDLAERAARWFRDRPDEIQEFPWEYAAALNVAERWEEARELAEQLARDRPDSVRYLGLLGVLEARVGHADEARRIDEELLTSRDEDPCAERHILPKRTFWRACIAAQLGQLDEAVRLLQRGFSEGLEFSDEFHRDINLEPLWDHPPFQELIRPKG
jgi:serine/threonine protein kinase/tetratricopeptide (TPR) repeat protein